MTLTAGSERAGLVPARVASALGLFGHEPVASARLAFRTATLLRS